MGHYRVLSRVPYSSVYMSIPISQFILFPFPPVTICLFSISMALFLFCGLPLWLGSKESACSAGDRGSILGLGRSSGGGHGNLLQYSYQENPIDRGAWWAMVYGVSKSQIQLKGLNTHAHISVLSVSSFVLFFFHSTHRQYHMILVLLCLTSFSMTVFRSIHVAANGTVSFFMAE